MSEIIRVLIADDDENARGYLRRILSIEDNIEIVGEVENGLEALELVKTTHPHVVLSDLNMPVMDGITACGEIKRAFPATQVIIMSVQDDSGPMKEAIDNGAAAFLIKPVMPEDLVDLIQRAHAAYVKLSPAV
jgi:DNA-binding NarL/FixJ family response regulator